MALYTPEMLALATGLSAYPLAGDFTYRASARSRTCGSVIELGLECDQASCITRIGMRLAACAIGQASAAIMAAGMPGRGASEIAATHQQLEIWLTGQGALPEWPGLNVIAPALPHKGRHSALLLPWTAATEALCSAETKR
ncbi:MAG: iron-sulfur cluster assembly scaffold protein [Erythrobacter sp.]